MEEYLIRIKEVSSRCVVVKTDSLEEAVNKVEDAANDNVIILDEDDFQDRIIEPAEDHFPGGIIPADCSASQYYWRIPEEEELL